MVLYVLSWLNLLGSHKLKVKRSIFKANEAGFQVFLVLMSILSLLDVGNGG